jgi:prepilin-type N-terminal cleavage/methylation domain-containing protein
MSARVRRALSGDAGVTLVELMVAIPLVAIIALGAGFLYVSARNALDLSTAESFVQRQGTLIEEEMVRQVSRANLLQVAECRPSGVTLAAGKSIIYNRRVQNAGTLLMEDETWCIFEHQPTGQPMQLRRCRVPGLTPPQDCSGTPENLLFGVPLRAGDEVRVSNTTFALASILCGGTPCATVTTADVRFTLELAKATGAAGLLTPAREFGFNLSIRN